MKNQHTVLVVVWNVSRGKERVQSTLKWQTNQSSSSVTHFRFALGLYHILYCSFLIFRNRVMYRPGLWNEVFYSADYTEQVLQEGSEQLEMANSRRVQDLLETMAVKTSGSLG